MKKVSARSSAVWAVRIRADERGTPHSSANWFANSAAAAYRTSLPAFSTLAALASPWPCASRARAATSTRLTVQGIPKRSDSSRTNSSSSSASIPRRQWLMCSTCKRSRAMRATPRPSSMSSAEVAASTSNAVESAPPDTISTTGAPSSGSPLPEGRSNRLSPPAYLRITLGMRTSLPHTVYLQDSIRVASRWSESSQHDNLEIGDGSFRPAPPAWQLGTASLVQSVGAMLGTVPCGRLLSQARGTLAWLAIGRNHDALYASLYIG